MVIVRRPNEQNYYAQYDCLGDVFDNEMQLTNLEIVDLDNQKVYVYDEHGVLEFTEDIDSVDEDDYL